MVFSSIWVLTWGIMKILSSAYLFNLSKALCACSTNWGLRISEIIFEWPINSPKPESKNMAEAGSFKNLNSDMSCFVLDHNLTKPSLSHVRKNPSAWLTQAKTTSASCSASLSPWTFKIFRPITLDAKLAFYCFKFYPCPNSYLIINISLSPLSKIAKKWHPWTIKSVIPCCIWISWKMVAPWSSSLAMVSFWSFE